MPVNVAFLGRTGGSGYVPGVDGLEVAREPQNAHQRPRWGGAGAAR
jgi:hypothetical protein